MFGLSLYTTERDLREVFSKYGPLASVTIVYDQQSRRSRGFAFVYFENEEDSKEVCGCGVCSRGAAALLYFCVLVLPQYLDCCSKYFCKILVLHSCIFRLKSKLTAWSWTEGVSEWTFPSPRDHTPPHLGFTWDGPPSECTLHVSHLSRTGSSIYLCHERQFLHQLYFYCSVLSCLG